MESMNSEGAECRRLREILGDSCVQWHQCREVEHANCFCVVVSLAVLKVLVPVGRPRGFAQCFSPAHGEQGVRAMSLAAKSTDKAPLAAKSTVKAPAQTFGVSGRYANALWQHANKVGILEAVSTFACSAPQVDVQGVPASAGRKEEQLATAALFLPIRHMIILYRSHCEPSWNVRKRLDTA